MQIFKSLRLATKDYIHEWQMSGCFALALAAVLGPMLVLFGLKFGIVGGMLDQLIEDPRNREVIPVGSGRFDRAWIEQFRRRDDVEFVVPRTRSLAATFQLKSTSASRIINAELISSDYGDPLLNQGEDLPSGMNRVVLSHDLAKKLNVAKGDTLEGSVTRRYRGKKERVAVPLKVSGIAPTVAFARDGAFATVELVEAIEDFRDGRAVPAMGWSGDRLHEQRTYPSFRMYARSIYDVENITNDLLNQGVETRTKAADIALVMRMDTNLSAVYWAIAIIGLVGFSLSLGASLWANVDRKRKELSVLRLVGFRTGQIVWFPVIQAFYTAVIGWIMAVAIFWGASLAINGMLADQLTPGQDVCRLLPGHYLWAFLLTTISAVISAAMAGYRSARIEPSEGLREI